MAPLTRKAAATDKQIRNKRSATDRNVDTRVDHVDGRKSKRVRKPVTGETEMENYASKVSETLSSEPNSTDLKQNGHDDFQNDLFARIIERRQLQKVPLGYGTLRVRSHSSMLHSSPNFVPYCYLHSMGVMGLTKLKQKATAPVVNLIKDLQLFRTSSPFDRRCTVIEWHPRKPKLLAVGSKGGDIILWNIEKNEPNMDAMIQGVGPGGTIQSLKFHPTIDTKVYTCCFDGKVSLHDLEGKHSEVFLDTMSSDHWYASLDMNPRINQMAAGHTSGDIQFLSMDGKDVKSLKLHKNKVTHIEYSPREEWLMISASMDKTVKVWDVRMIKDRKSCLETLEHDRAINSAYFSLTDGCRLLTTDQGQEMRVYDTATWRQEKKIFHPHRSFQHLTPMKAHWHPLADLIIIGRYPDPNFPSYTKDEKRTIDIFDPDTGDMVTQLYDSNAPGLISLNKFNPQGDTLASTMGVNILLWKRKEELEERNKNLMTNIKHSGQEPPPPHPGAQQGPKKSKPRRDKNTKTKTETKKLAEKKLKQKK